MCAKKRTLTSEELHANRMKRIDDDEASARRYGLNYRFMHMSALAPTTRASHAARHGKLFTAQEVREWWAKDDNWVDCRCGIVPIMVDDRGNPLIPDAVQRARETLKQMKKQGYDWAKEL